ncbi:STAS domain-containing protein [Amycolatopsis carbonis]|uniref:Anti-sigma factor antagonist n=1 Tax=Amycolatopsis carbonis TaxID=715471 RepID=A0A9Y2MZN0_9PSEU|nr:STAS domain-containing protein [Amycolatopsis sp. 2-15]WIX82778.1 STAS domain-containing protein [Amycolatopsis sp. 2-15]
MTIEFTVTTRDTASGPVLELSGELDAATAPDALEAIRLLAPAAGQQLLVDLSGLEFCDSSGVSALIAARNVALAAGAAIALAAVPGQLARTLDLIGLAELFKSYSTTEDARKAWAASASDQ